MEKLKEHFTRQGYTYDMVSRSNVSAIFEQKLSGKLIAFEVIKIKICKEGVLNNRHYPEREVYPNDNDWGTYGWTYWSLGEAQAKFDELNRQPVKETI